jgi:hypothetical protein
MKARESAAIVFRKQEPCGRRPDAGRCCYRRSQANFQEFGRNGYRKLTPRAASEFDIHRQAFVFIKLLAVTKRCPMVHRSSTKVPSRWRIHAASIEDRAALGTTAQLAVPAGLRGWAPRRHGQRPIVAKDMAQKRTIPVKPVLIFMALDR